MLLQPCTRCHRHVAASESVCPFCGAAVIARTPRPVLVGRLGRAAAFAGLALTSCYTSASPPQPQLPGDSTEGRRGAPIDAGSPLASPPQDARQGTARIHGMVTDQHGAPLAGVYVVLTAGEDSYQTRTDPSGRYAVEKVPGGTYTPHFSVRMGGRGGYSRRPTLQIADGADERMDVSLNIQPTPPPAKPYGAPPARHRVV